MPSDRSERSLGVPRLDGRPHPPLPHGSTGSAAIKPGTAADIVAAPGDPLADATTIRKVNFVMKDGKVFVR